MFLRFAFYRLYFILAFIFLMPYITFHGLSANWGLSENILPLDSVPTCLSKLALNGENKEGVLEECCQNCKFFTELDLFKTKNYPENFSSIPNDFNLDSEQFQIASDPFDNQIAL